MLKNQAVVQILHVLHVSFAVLLGLVILAAGLALIIWADKFHAWDIKEKEKMMSPNNLFLQSWKHPSNIWLIRIMGVAATVMACILLGEILFG